MTIIILFFKIKLALPHGMRQVPRSQRSITNRAQKSMELLIGQNINAIKTMNVLILMIGDATMQNGGIA